MVSQGKARLFKRKDGKYLVYLPLDLCTDSQFPFQDFEETESGVESVRLTVTFDAKNKSITLTLRD